MILYLLKLFQYSFVRQRTSQLGIAELTAVLKQNNRKQTNR